MSTQTELAASINAVKDQLAKVGTEINGKIAELTAALDNAGAVSPEVQDAIDGLKAAAQSLDDIVPDAPLAEENETPEIEETPTPEETQEAPLAPPSEDEGQE